MQQRARTSGAAPRADGGDARRLPLVGRDAERRVLSAALDRVERGEGGLAVVSGVAGTGRTRVAREVLAEAGSRGFRTVEGRGHVLAQERAWAAVTDALEPVLRRLDRGELLSLAGDLPELGAIVGYLGLGPRSRSATRCSNGVACWARWCGWSGWSSCTWHGGRWPRHGSSCWPPAAREPATPPSSTP